MSVARVEAAGARLKLFVAPDAPGEVNTPAEIDEQQRIRNPLSLAGQRIAEQFSEVKVSDRDKLRASTELTTSEFYRRYLFPGRAKLDPKTRRIDADALAWFASVGIPEDWPVFEQWEGPPIACVTSPWIDSLVEESLASGLATNTIGKYLRHLRTIWNAAARLGLMPKLQVTIPEEDPEARPYSDLEVERIYHALAQMPALQVAFVLALATGPRFSDLFWLPWEQIDFDRRQVDFCAVKTGKHQVIPLAEVPLLHLQRLPKYEAPFASLIDQSIPPEFRAEHYQARAINARWRQLTGFAAPPRMKKHWPADCVSHPWHSARSTAAVWIERVASGMASRLLGHSEGGADKKRKTRQQQGERVTRKHYLTPLASADIRAAAEAVQWPSYFRDLAGPRQMTLF